MLHTFHRDIFLTDPIPVLFIYNIYVYYYIYIYTYKSYGVQTQHLPPVHRSLRRARLGHSRRPRPAPATDRDPRRWAAAAAPPAVGGMPAEPVSAGPPRFTASPHIPARTRAARCSLPFRCALARSDLSKEGRRERTSPVCAQEGKLGVAHPRPLK